MENLTFFILGASLTSLCFLIYIKRKKKTRGRKVIWGNTNQQIGDIMPVARLNVESQIRKGKGGIYQ